MVGRLYRSGVRYTHHTSMFGCGCGGGFGGSMKLGVMVERCHR